MNKKLIFAALLFYSYKYSIGLEMPFTGMLNKPDAQWYAVQVSDTTMLMSDLQFVQKTSKFYGC